MAVSGTWKAQQITLDKMAPQWPAPDIGEWDNLQDGDVQRAPVLPGSPPEWVGDSGDVLGEFYATNGPTYAHDASPTSHEAPPDPGPIAGRHDFEFGGAVVVNPTHNEDMGGVAQRSFRRMPFRRAQQLVARDEVPVGQTFADVVPVRGANSLGPNIPATVMYPQGFRPGFTTRYARDSQFQASPSRWVVHPQVLRNPHLSVPGAGNEVNIPLRAATTYAPMVQRSATPWEDQSTTDGTETPGYDYSGDAAALGY